MKVLWLVKHEVTWEGDSSSDIVNAKVVATSPEEAMAKHVKSLKKWKVKNDDGKEVKLKKIKFYSIVPLENVDL